MPIYLNQSRMDPTTVSETQSFTLHAYAERRQRARRNHAKKWKFVVHVPDKLASCIRDGKHDWLVIHKRLHYWTRRGQVGFT